MTSPFTRHDKTLAVGGLTLTPRAVIGLFIALLGVVLTLDRLGLVNAGIVLRFWPVGIIAVGAVLFSQGRARGGGINGIIVMGIGLWVLLNTTGLSRVHIWDLFWPIVLILIGTALVRQTMRHPESPDGPGIATSGTAGVAPEDRFSVFAVMSGVKRSSTSQHFRGGDVFAFMGGCNLDLRQATIAPGETAVIDVFAMMGGGEITVPATWTVDTPLLPIMGGIDDRRLPPLAPPAPGPGGAAPPRLVLRGFILMGGIQLKS